MPASERLGNNIYTSWGVTSILNYVSKERKFGRDLRVKYGKLPRNEVAILSNGGEKERNKRKRSPKKSIQGLNHIASEVEYRKESTFAGRPAGGSQV